MSARRIRNRGARVVQLYVRLQLGTSLYYVTAQVKQHVSIPDLCIINLILTLNLNFLP